MTQSSFSVLPVLVSGRTHQRWPQEATPEDPTPAQPQPGIGSLGVESVYESPSAVLTDALCLTPLSSSPPASSRAAL